MPLKGTRHTMVCQKGFWLRSGYGSKSWVLRPGDCVEILEEPDVMYEIVKVRVLSGRHTGRRGYTDLPGFAPNVFQQALEEAYASSSTSANHKRDLGERLEHLFGVKTPSTRLKLVQ